MLNNNVPPLVVSKVLGHSRPSTTMDIYAHLYHASLDEAARLMDQLVTPQKTEQKAEKPLKKDSLT